MKIVIRINGICGISYSQDDKPSGQYKICVKTKDRTVYFPLYTIDFAFYQKIRVMHKGKEYGLPFIAGY